MGWVDQTSLLQQDDQRQLVEFSTILVKRSATAFLAACKILQIEFDATPDA